MDKHEPGHTRSRIMREVETFNMCKNHPNIVQLHEVKLFLIFYFCCLWNVLALFEGCMLQASVLDVFVMGRFLRSALEKLYFSSFSSNLIFWCSFPTTITFSPTFLPRCYSVEFPDRLPVIYGESVRGVYFFSGSKITTTSTWYSKKCAEDLC